MPLERLPPIALLHSYSDLAQTEVLDQLFEPSPAIHATLLPVIRTAFYKSYPDLIDACQIKLLSLAAKSAETEPNPLLLSVLCSHPRLGQKNIKSAQSIAEQANLQGESEQLAALNKEYEETFQGLRYVVFVNGRGLPEIMDDMRARIDRNDLSREVDAALQALCDIAKARASKLPEETNTRKPSNGN
ncbi:Oxo-4-hydroxy-4-carboxy-5-ureidoimidazoline decarboxylase [Trichoderma novae-zelandiae]